jgi:ribosomal protein S18 acetylase RimI-like enzyme
MMAISSSISRLAGYYARHGLGATIRRTVLSLRRTLLSSRAVLFYCDLSGSTTPRADLPSFLKVERKRSHAEIAPQDLDQMINVWNPKLADRNMKERFANGASLWLIKFGDRLAGYGWTLRGRPIAPYYFPLGEDDVQFFDFYVFAKYRGRAIDWCLMTHALQSVAVDGAARAFAEAGEWNQASLSSLAMTSFRPLGCARKLTIFRYTIVFWAHSDSKQPERKVGRERLSTAAPAEKIRPSTISSRIS